MAEERYRLEQQLGEGGMGKVWLATDTLLDRPVAMKFLQATNNLKHRELFLSEARTLASLRHPNITLIYDAVFDENKNRFYIMMEYVEGKPLSTLIYETGKPLPVETILNITTGMLQALQYAHKKGFVHRDIKPDNVIIQDDGVIKLTDFGLASLVSILAEQDDGYIVGTPLYMSPELIAGENVDGRADLYALGVTLFEMVTGGRCPFEHEHPQDILTAHIQETPPSVRQFEATVPLLIERVIARLLSKYPEDRYPSAQTVLDIVNAIQSRQKFSQGHLQLLEHNIKPLVDRKNEMGRLNAIWADVQESSRSHLVVLSGESGIGKNRLLVEFFGNSVVDKGMVVAAGRCYEAGAAYTPFAEIISTIFDKGLIAPTTIESHIDYLAEQIPGLAPLLNIKPLPRQPEEKTVSAGGGLWQTLSNRLPVDGAADARQQTQLQFFTTIANILAELGPSVILLNDAGHLDESSIGLTRFLVRQTQSPLLIVATIKENSPWIETFSNQEMTLVGLSPLPSNLIKEYLVNFLESDVSGTVVRIVEKQSRGVPLRIEEVTRHLIEMGDFYRNKTGQWEYQPPPVTGNLSQNLLSPTLSNAFTRRLDKLSPESRDILTLAALLEPNPEFDFEMWLEFIGDQPKQTLAQKTVDDALRHRILREVGKGRYAFRPADIATALVALIAPANRRNLHQQIAELLIKRGVSPLLIGHHYEQAGLPAQSARYLESAGEKAVSANNVKPAIDYYLRATNLVETVSGYKALGNLYRQQGDWANSKTAYLQAMKLISQQVNPDNNTEQQAAILNGLVFTLWLSDQYREASQYASFVLKLSDVSVLERATAQTHLGMVSWLLGHLAEAENWCRKAVGSLTNSSEQAKLAEAYNRLGLVFFTRGKFSEAADVTSLSLRLRQTLGHRWGEAYCLVGMGQIEADQGNFEIAMQYFSSARKLFEQIHSVDGLMVVNTEQGRALLLQNSINDAVPLIGKALRMAKKIGKQSAYGLGDIYLLIAQASLQLNKLKQARDSVNDALKLVETAGNRKYVAVGQAILAQIYAAEGEPVQAEALFKKALTLFEKIDHPAGLLRTQLSYARFRASLGQTKTAADIEKRTLSAAANLGLYLYSES